MVQKGTDILPVMESFYSIQGEGHHSGKPAYFIRLAGCDVKCKWCDVKESWDIRNDQYLKVFNIIESAQNVNSDIVVITGGEPLSHNLFKLSDGLKKIGKNVHIETSGSEPLTGNFDWICLSPKKNKKPLGIYYEICDELKVIIYTMSDFRWAERNFEMVNKKSKLILQPEWSVEEQVIPHIVDYVKKNPHWKISLQTHKYLNVD